MEERGDSTIPAPTERLPGLDLARGLAYFGMVVVNLHLTMTWGIPESSLVPAWLETGIQALFGRAAATFVFIAGVGLSLRWQFQRTSTIARGGRVLGRCLLLLFLLVAIAGIAFHITRAEVLGTASVGSLGKEANWPQVWRHLQHFFSHPLIEPARNFVIGALTIWLSIAILFLGRLERFSGPRSELFLRALFLFACGYLWQPIWSGDILHFYGLWLILALPLLGAPLPLLLVASLLLGCGAIGLHLVWDYGSSWTDALEYDGFWTPAGQAKNLVFDGWHPLLPWFGFLVGGLALGRCRLDRLKAPIVALLLGAALIAVAAPLSQKATEAVIEGSKLVADAEVAAPEMKVQEAPARPAWARGPELVYDADLETPTAVAVTAFLARELEDWPIRRFILRDFDGRAGVELELAAGTTHKERRALLADILPWYLDDDARSHPVWPGSLRVLAVTHLLAGGDRTTEIFDREKNDELPFDQAVTLLFGMQALPPGPFFFLEAMGVALFTLGACFLLLRIRILRRLAHPVVQTGKMAFTLYLLHVILGMGVLDLLKLLRGQGLPFTAVVILVVNLLSMAFACAWLALFRRGPIEAVMRRLCR